MKDHTSENNQQKQHATDVDSAVARSLDGWTEPTEHITAVKHIVDGLRARPTPIPTGKSEASTNFSRKWLAKGPCNTYFDGI